MGRRRCLVPEVIGPPARGRRPGTTDHAHREQVLMAQVWGLSPGVWERYALESEGQGGRDETGGPER